ncbi:flagellar biosynthetic protein FliR [Cupriavidus plantarum]|uniref:Flagellar biosynthetic protein FliR n=1 Tax=Cupriavidus plantarum TaxID=942865 RepID=A0A316EUD1_9BURK|nr:flagellar biosynthetic protein FliR [Cupriavidus plantarum]NYI01226.1 flagellar biosynthetic protein FliR [Cupriavidus plantarum]PWK35616.1 flagellar biosynthetic protein FliR [Cupriavidus plantarum]REE94078.1 flagellar biosynthetic protein FliR [Cupriavidus plantarum]RLK39492.1 flagellar biosynthetic protein FliR [Cupriavidus plantarum]CAG2133461.1 Flagellar biosynthetic protein FliR [Cupriavidus plantarum]
MLDVSTDQLYGWIAAFLWPLFRLLALIGTAPLFGESSIPRRAKVALAALLAAVVSPTIPNIPAVPAYSYEGLLIVLNEVGIGVAMGFTMRLAFAAVQVAGEVIGLQMGLSFAAFYDRNAGGQTMVLSRFLNLVAMLMFLAMDGHLTMLATVVDSFNALPIAASPLSGHGWGAVARAGAQVFAWGTLLSLPMIATLLTLNLAMGILNRASPQLSIFAVGFPVTLAGGMLVLMLVMPQMGAYMQHLLEAALQTMTNVLEQFAN